MHTGLCEIEYLKSVHIDQSVRTIEKLMVIAKFVLTYNYGLDFLRDALKFKMVNEWELLTAAVTTR